MRTETNACLTIALPPRNLKSIICSAALPAWLLGHDPGVEVVCASYGQDLAEDFGGKTLRIMESDWYMRLFPATQLSRKAVRHLETTKGGKRYATSVDGTFTGTGADVVIIDDSLKADDAYSDTARNTANRWARNTVFSRFDKKLDVRMIVVQQRLHEDDLFGHLHETGLSFPAIAVEDEVHTIQSPYGTRLHVRKKGEALHPEREPIVVLERLRRLMGTEHFEPQYQQNPAPPGGGVVKLKWFNRYDLAERPHFARRVISWDTASKVKELNSYSVATVWGVTIKGDIYLMHVFRERLEYPDLKRKVLELAREFRANEVLVEDASSGVQLIQELRREGLPQIVAVRALGEKELRMRSQTPVMESGHVWLPREAAWLHTFESELAVFPKGRFDDQADSVSQALEFIGRPVPEDGFYALAIMETLARYGLKPADLSITFDHPDPKQEWTSVLRRTIRRKNGYFTCCEQEWADLRHQYGVRLIDGGEG